MTIQIYNYHPITKQYLPGKDGEIFLADECQLTRDPIVPGDSTTIAPPEAVPHVSYFFKNDKWEAVPDWRGVKLYDTKTGQPVSILVVNKTPIEINATDLVPENPYQKWDGSKWVEDSVKKQAYLKKLISESISTIENLYASTIQSLLGTPSSVEKETWTLKLDIAKAIVQNKTVSAEGISFLNGFGLNDSAEKQKAWAESVLDKASKYAFVVGACENARTEAKDMLRACKLIDEVAVSLELAKTGFDEVVAKLK